MFQSRQQAGRELARELQKLQLAGPIVLALPRGGALVAAEIADSLNAPLWEAPAIYSDKQDSQEFQLTYTGSKWQGVAGLFYMKTNAFNEFDVLYNASGGLSLLTRDDIDSKTWAIYADASYSVSDTFTPDSFAFIAASSIACLARGRSHRYPSMYTT